MIDVTVARNREYLQTVVIEGHAGSGPHGFDLVCAGVSSVSFGAVNAVEALCDVTLVVDQAQDGGYMRIDVPDGLSHEQEQSVQLLLEGMLVSLRTIENSYSEFIQLND